MDLPPPTSPRTYTLFPYPTLSRSQRDRERHAEDDELGGVAQRLPEQRRVGERDVIIEPDEAQIAEIGERVDVEIGEAQEQRRRDGQREEQPQRGERRSEEHTSELQSLMRIAYAVCCLKKKKQ